MKNLLQILCWLACLPISFPLASSALAQNKACNPAPPEVAKLIEIRPSYHIVQGPLAEFDPCHSSVDLSMPSFFADKLGTKPPLMLIAHGGGGAGMAEKEMARRMNAQGVATLLFDAYELNGFKYRGSMLFVNGVTNESRQRMIYKAAFTAYQWVAKQDSIDTTRIFINGLSNGGSVAVNLAATVDPTHVRMVFAEGASPSGLGLPDQLKVPLWLIYGKLDNYGGKTADDWMLSRTDPCSFNVDFFMTAAGTSKRCSSLFNPQDMVITPQAWADELKSRGQPIEIRHYEEAAHGILLGPINRKQVTYGSGPMAKVRYAWTGSGSGVPERFIQDLMTAIKASY